MTRTNTRSAAPLPSQPIRAALLWDVVACDESAHRGFLFSRTLGHGSVEDIRGLRRRFGDAAIRDHLLVTNGRRIDRPRLRYLEAILELDREVVDGWLGEPARRLWDER